MDIPIDFCEKERIFPLSNGKTVTFHDITIDPDNQRVKILIPNNHVVNQNSGKENFTGEQRATEVSIRKRGRKKLITTIYKYHPQFGYRWYDSDNPPAFSDKNSAIRKLKKVDLHKQDLKGWDIEKVQELINSAISILQQRLNQ